MKLFVGSLFAFVATVALVGCGGEPKPAPAPVAQPSPEAMMQHAAATAAEEKKEGDAATPAAAEEKKEGDAAAPAAAEEKKEEAKKE